MLCYPTDYRYSYSRIKYATIYAAIMALNSMRSALIEGIHPSVDQIWKKTLRKVQQSEKKTPLYFSQQKTMRTHMGKEGKKQQLQNT